jgi:hypothetical protein
MLPLQRTVYWKNALLSRITVFALLLLTAPILCGAQSPKETSPLSHAQLASLRQAALPDLRKAVGTFNNDSGTRDVSAEWKLCKITPIRLGTLGLAVVVEWNPLKAPNASMINIYLPAHGGYQLLLGSAGFGPTVLHGNKPVPDLVFGGTGGVCHAVYSRYRYQGGRYAVDACNQEKEAKDGDCAIVACEHRNFPTFPNPFPN